MRRVLSSARAQALLAAAVQRPRVWKYRALSTCDRVSGTPVVLQPVLLLGPGRIVLGAGVELGWPASQGFYTGYSHLEVATAAAVIEIGDGAQINNGAFLKSEGPGIRIGARALLGSDVTILDSDFHELAPDRRRGGHPRMGAVEIGENAFVGQGATILKGVTIGADAVVGAGSVVTRSVPDGAIATGNPARIVGMVAVLSGNGDAAGVPGPR